MQGGKIVGICLISAGIALLILQVVQSAALREPAQQGHRKIERDLRGGPYAGIFGVALIVGGVGFVFTSRRREEPDSRRALR